MSTKMDISMENNVVREINEEPDLDSDSSGGESDGTNPGNLEKKCLVCGDKATGQNYGVLSCESCKAFFRRHEMKGLMELPCLQESMCEITITTRKHCLRCRLRKCFEVGMAVTNIIPRRKRRRRVTSKESGQRTPASPQPPLLVPQSYDNTFNNSTNAEPVTRDDGDSINHAERRSTAGVEVTFDLTNIRQQTNTDIMIPSQNITAQQKGQDLVLTMRLPKGTAVKNIFSIIMDQLKNRMPIRSENSDQGEHSGSYQSNEFGQYDDNSIPKNVVQDVMAQQYPLDTQQYGSDAQSSDINLSQNLETFPNQDAIRNILLGDGFNFQLPQLSPEIVNLELRSIRVEELHTANDAWNKPSKVTHPLHGRSAADFTLEDFIYMVHHTFSYCIKQHRELSALKKLHLEDQVELLKTRVLELSLIRYICKYNANTDRTDIQYPGCPDGISLDLAKRVKGGTNHEMIKMKEMFPDKFRLNETLMLLISAVALFDPKGMKLTNVQAVMFERNAFLQLLKDHLESTYGVIEGREGYKCLLVWLDRASWFVKNCYATWILDLHPRTLDLLMIEMFGFS